MSPCPSRRCRGSHRTPRTRSRSSMRRRRTDHPRGRSRLADRDSFQIAGMRKEDAPSSPSIAVPNSLPEETLGDMRDTPSSSVQANPRRPKQVLRAPTPRKQGRGADRNRKSEGRICFFSRQSLCGHEPFDLSTECFKNHNMKGRVVLAKSQAQPSTDTTSARCGAYQRIPNRHSRSSDLMPKTHNTRLLQHPTSL